MKRIAVWASGSGSNAQKLLAYFEQNPQISIELIVTNKAEAGVVNIAKSFGKDVLFISKEELSNSAFLLEKLSKAKIDFIVLGGFLLKIPDYMIAAFPNRIINIHPALLPKFGGKGMYGLNVHQAVKASAETETGISIHLVNEHYDEGRILFQGKCEVLPTDSPADIALKVQTLEHCHFAKEVEKYILSF